MKIGKTLIITLMLLCSCLFAAADVIVLHSGQKLTGEIILQNDQIVVVKTQQGQRFQFPMNEVKNISVQDDEPVGKDDVSESYNSSVRPVSMRLSVFGGGCFAGKAAGGMAAADVAVGTRIIKGKRMFIGGSVGYLGCFADGSVHFLPVQAAFSAPLTSHRHAPEFGLSLGYGVGLKAKGMPHAYGGITGGVHALWRWQITPSTALMAGVAVRFLQSKITTTETIQGEQFSTISPCCFLMPAAHLALQL